MADTEHVMGIEGASSAYESLVRSRESQVINPYQDNVMAELQRSMGDTQRISQACLEQNEVERKRIKWDLLIAKDMVLSDFRGTWKLQPEHITFIYLQPSTTYSSDLRCRLVEHHGFEPNEFSIRSIRYIALSYTWGNPIFNRTLYRLHGDDIMITENLESALRKIRHTSNEQILWVDAVCIDQNDLAERTIQVKTMHSIYYQADEVHAWLGPESELNDGEICFSLFELLFKQLTNHHAQHHPWDHDESVCHEGQTAFSTTWAKLRTIVAQFDTAHITKVLNKFFERKYFSRRWIIQEIIFSQNLILHCGNSTLQWTLDSECSKLLFLYALKPIVDETITTRLNATLLCKGQKLVHMKSPVDVLLKADRFDCADDRDRVVSLLHVFRLFKISHDKNFDHILKEISYFSSVEDVYLTFAQFSMRYGASRTVQDQYADLEMDEISHLLLVACSTRGPLNSHTERNTSHHSIPSWVPDWRHSPRYAIPRKIRGSLAASNISCELPDRLNAICWGCSQFNHRHNDDFLHAWGMPFDIIKETRIFSQAEILDQSYYTRALELNLRFLSQKICGNSVGELCKYYYTPTGEEFKVSLTITLIANHEHCNHDTASQEKNCSIQIDDNFLKATSTAASRPLPGNEKGLTSAYYSLLAQTMRGRCFFTTEKGYIGIGPDDTQTKDVVCIFSGLRMPLIIRTQSTGVLKTCCKHVWALETNAIAGDGAVEAGLQADACLVGDAYIHGIMDGKAVGKDWIRSPGAFQPLYIV